MKAGGDDRKAIDEIRDRLPIIDIIGETVALKRAGGTYKGLCPFHSEKTPSFTVSNDRGLFKCFGCGESGDIFAFVMKTNGVGFGEALRELAQRAGVTLDRRGREESGARETILEMNSAALKFFQEHLASSEGSAARSYLAQRGINQAMIEKFQIGLAHDAWDALLKRFGKKYPSETLATSGLFRERETDDGKSKRIYDLFRNRIIFPIFDVSSRPIAFGAREYRDDRGPKYINSPETILYIKGRNLYGLHLAKEAIKRSSRAVLVEGYTDVIIAHKHGFANVVASQGTALTPDQVSVLSRLGAELVLAYDPDSAGRNAADRGIDIALDRGLSVRVADLPEGLDPADAIEKHGPAAFGKALDSAQDFIEHRIAHGLRSVGARSSVVDRARAAKTLLDSLPRISDRIVRAMLIKTISERFGVPEEILVSESSLNSGSDSSRQARQGSSGKVGERAPRQARDERNTADQRRETGSKPQEPGVRPVHPVRELDSELAILRMMLDDIRLVGRARGALDAAAFSKPVRGEVFTALLSAADAGEPFKGDLGGRVTGLGLELLAHISTAPCPDGDKKQLFDDYVKGIRLKNINAQIGDCTMSLQVPDLGEEDKRMITQRLSALLKEKSVTMSKKKTTATMGRCAPQVAQSISAGHSGMSASSTAEFGKS